MLKSEQFKKWFAEHINHSPQLQLAYDAIIEQEEQVKFEQGQKAIAREQRDKAVSNLTNIVNKYNDASSDIATLFEHLPQDRETGEYPIDGQSMHELQKAILSKQT